MEYFLSLELVLRNNLSVWNNIQKDTTWVVYSVRYWAEIIKYQEGKGKNAGSAC